MQKLYSKKSCIPSYTTAWKEKAFSWTSMIQECHLLYPISTVVNPIRLEQMAGSYET